MCFTQLIAAGQCFRVLGDQCSGSWTIYCISILFGYDVKTVCQVPASDRCGYSAASAWSALISYGTNLQALWHVCKMAADGDDWVGS